jgi:hypothetical protein
VEVTTLTLEQAQQKLADAARQALQGESVLIIVGAETLRLSAEVPLRPPGFFAQRYLDPEDAEFEERIACDSALVIEP